MHDAERDEHARRDEPRDEPFGDRPDVAERPAAAVVRMLRVLDVADDRVELAFEIACFENVGITYGPMRTASAICVGVASCERRRHGPVT